MHINRLLVAIVAQAALGCSPDGGLSAEKNEPATTAAGPWRLAADFEVEVDQRAGTMTFTPAATRAPGALSVRSFQRIPNTGQPNTVKFVNNWHSAPDTTCGRPPVSHSFCASVSIQSFFSVPIDRVWVRFTEINGFGVTLREKPQDALPSDLEPYIGQNAGLLNYGRLDPHGEATRDDWDFSVPDAGNFQFKVQVWGDPRNP